MPPPGWAEAFIALDNSDAQKTNYWQSSRNGQRIELSKLDALRLAAVMAMARRNLQEAINAFSGNYQGLVLPTKQARPLLISAKAYESNEQVDKAMRII